MTDERLAELKRISGFMIQPCEQDEKALLDELLRYIDDLRAQVATLAAQCGYK